MARKSRRLEDQLGHSAAQSGFLTDTNTYEDIGSSISQMDYNSPPALKEKHKEGKVSEASFVSTNSDLYSSFNVSTATAEMISRMHPDEAMNDSTIRTDLTISIDSLVVSSPVPHTGWYCVEGSIITTSKLQNLRKRKGMPVNKTPVATFRTGLSPFVESKCDWRNDARKSQKFRINGVRLPVERCHDSQLNRRYLELVVLKADHPNASRSECVPFMKDKALADLVYKGSGSDKKRRRAQMTLLREGTNTSYTLQVYVTMCLVKDDSDDFVPQRLAYPPPPPILGNPESDIGIHTPEFDDVAKEEEEERVRWSIVGRNLIVGVVGGAVVGSAIGGLLGLAAGKSAAATPHVVHATAVATPAAAKTATAASTAKATTAAAASKTAATTGQHAASTSHAGLNGAYHQSAGNVGANTSATSSSEPSWTDSVLSGAWIGAVTGFVTSIVCTATSTPSCCDPYSAPADDEYSYSYGDVQPPPGPPGGVEYPARRLRR